MKKTIITFLLLTCLVLTGCGVTKQNTSDAPTNEWPIDKISNTESSILFIGDSLAWNMARDGKSYAPSMNIINRGRPGESSNFIKNIWASEALNYKWKAIVVTCGTNDLGHTNIDFVTQNIEYMVDSANKMGNTIVICTLPPRSSNSSKTGLINNYIKNELNSSYDIKILDNESLWCTINSTGSLEFIPENTYDGVHPTVVASYLSIDALQLLLK